jgi:hypothetical protein
MRLFVIDGCEVYAGTRRGALKKYRLLKKVNQ